MPPESVDILINGAPQQVAADQNVATLLRLLGIESDRVAVEMDRVIVRKRDWERTPVLGGSTIEIVQFVGGG